MGMTGEVAYVLAKKYVQATAAGLGAVKGAPVTILSIEEIDGGHTITFGWTGTDGSSQSSTLDVMDGAPGKPGPKGDPGGKGDPGENGVGITGVAKVSSSGNVDTYRITFSDGNTFDYDITNGSTSWGGISDKPFNTLNPTQFTVDDNSQLSLTASPSESSIVYLSQDDYEAKLKAGELDEDTYYATDKNVGGETPVANDYTKLDNKPSIQGTKLIGNKTLADLGIASKLETDAASTRLNDLCYGDLAGGKNLVNYKEVSGWAKISQGDSIALRKVFKLIPNTSYTISQTADRAGSSYIWAVSGNDVDFTADRPINGCTVDSPRTIISDSDGYITVGVFGEIADDIVQLEEGDTATKHESFIPSVKTIYDDQAGHKLATAKSSWKGLSFYFYKQGNFAWVRVQGKLTAEVAVNGAYEEWIVVPEGFEPIVEDVCYVISGDYKFQFNTGTASKGVRIGYAKKVVDNSASTLAAGTELHFSRVYICK